MKKISMLLRFIGLTLSLQLMLSGFLSANDPVDPNDPDYTEDPNNPGEPTDPVDPSDPDYTDDPNNPVDPTDPDYTDDPNNPVDPTDPDYTDDPNNPVDPTDPDYTDDPNNPVDPTDPDYTDDPNNPVDPTDPDYTDDPNNPVDPNDPDYTDDPNNPVDPNDPDYTDDPNNPEEPTDPLDPNDPDYTDDPHNPEDPTDPLDPNDPDYTDDPHNPEDPTDPLDPNDPDYADDPSNPEDPAYSENLRILCLHGGGGSAEGLRQQSGMLALINAFPAYEFIFASAPGEGGLWIQDPPGGKDEPTTDPDWALDSITYLNEFVAENGPFHGILGYSQGSAMATLFLASGNHTFGKVLLFNGYLPETHEGLMQRINEASLAPLNALVFAGENDHIISSQLSQQLSTQFESPVFILSTEAGHHLPDPSDPTFSQVTDFLAATQIPHDDDPNHVDDPDIPEGTNDAHYTVEDLPQPARDWISTSVHDTANILSVRLYYNITVSPHDFHDQGYPEDGPHDPADYDHGDPLTEDGPHDPLDDDQEDSSFGTDEPLDGLDIWAVELDTGKELFFNEAGEHLHTALVDSEETPALAAEEIPQMIQEWLESNDIDLEVADVFKEESVEEGSESSMYLVDLPHGLTAVFDASGVFLNAHYDDHIDHDDEGGHHDDEGGKDDYVPWEPEEWKPFELPQSAKDYLSTNYPEIHFWAEEQEVEGQKQIIVFLDNNLDAFFDSEGNFLKVIDPWAEKLKNLNPGLKFSAEDSSWGDSGTFAEDTTTGTITTAGGTTPAYLAVSYTSISADDYEGIESGLTEPADVAGDEDSEEIPEDASPYEHEENHHKGSMLYRIAFTNSAPPDDGMPSVQEANLANTDLPAGTELKLKFTYDFGPVRYIAVNGAEITAFTHKMPDWKGPGCITITAKTVDPPATASDADGTLVGSSFGMMIEMGGEYRYEGAIFLTDALWADVNQPQYTFPWEPVAAFNVAGQDGASANFTAYIPLSLSKGRFRISHLQDLSAAVLKEDGSLAFIAGSTVDQSAPTIGSGWAIAPYQGSRGGHPREGYDPGGEGYDPGGEGYDPGGEGYDPGGEGYDPGGEGYDPGGEGYDPGGEGYDPGGETIHDDHEVQPSVHDGESHPDDEDLLEGTIAESFIDFDGDGLNDTFAAISFSNDSWSSADVQVGDPYLDPFANLDKSSFGSISGTITTTDGGVPEDYWVSLEKQAEGSDDPSRGESAFIEFTAGDDGAYTVKVAPGTYFLKAEGFDMESGIRYKPRHFKDESGPVSFTVEDASTELTGIDFALKAEFQNKGKSRSNIRGKILSGGKAVMEANIEAYPIDEDGELLSDEPVGHGWVDPNGSYMLEAPEGKLLLVISTWDNSFEPEEVIVDLTADIELEGQDFTLVERGEATVKGSVTDVSGNPVHAQLIFVDAENEDRHIWPKQFELEMDEDGGTGHFTAKVPSGSYKIYAELWDGSLLPAFYLEGESGASDFDDATTVIVGDEEIIEGVAIELAEKPTSTLTFKVEDSDGSTPLEWAWAFFSDPDDEYEQEFSHIEPSVPFDGSYTAKISGGQYKVEIDVPGYSSVFYGVDASGETDWTAIEWQDGAVLTLTDGETTDLGVIRLTAEAITDEDALAFLDFGTELDAPEGATISGIVTTPDGSPVPQSQIIAHDIDHLMWLDHVQTKSDGSFTLDKLPARTWVVYALPPFESEKYRSYQKSNKLDLDLEDGEVLTGQTLTLTTSNVASRVMFSRKNPDGTSKLVPLREGFIWAYADENDVEDPDDLTEEYVQINKDGFFTLGLGTTGGYSLEVVDLPPEHRASDLGPVSFNITNPSQLLKLGNAIELRWETKLNATSFGIERKTGSTGSYKSILSADLASSVRSYIDTTITPGEDYLYRVTANLSSGSTALDDTSLKQTSPFLYLAPSAKTIIGNVVDSSGSTISGAEVFAFSERGLIKTTTDSSGAYELIVGPGIWDVKVAPARGTKVGWFYDGLPEEVEFTSDGETESNTVNFEVSVLDANNKISGRILKPDGSSDWSDIASYVEVDAFNPRGEGGFTQINEDGTFEIQLPRGGYELFVWVDPEKFPTYISPETQHVRVKGAEVALGDLTLGSISSKITGTLTDASGTALPNFFVVAMNPRSGDFVEDVTNAAGSYELNVGPGAWRVSFEAPLSEGGGEVPYLMQPPQRVKIDADQTKSLDFTVAKADSSISGSIVDSNGNPADSDLDLFVFVRNATEGAGRHDHVGGAEVDSRGKFTLNLSDGEYSAGAFVPQESGYRLQSEVSFTVSGGEVSYGGDATTLTLVLLSNDAVVSGTLSLNDSPISGVKGDVYAVSGNGGWVETGIDTDGTYSLTLAPGDWRIGYEILSDSDSSRTLLRHPAFTTKVTAVSGSTVTQDFVLKTAGATISGTLTDETGAQLSDQTAYVWVHRSGDVSYDEYETEIESTDGTFTLKVEAGGQYKVGAFISPQLREAGYLAPDSQVADIDATGSATVTLALNKLAEDNFISGTVTADGSAVESAYVYAWSEDDLYADATTDSDGAYKLLVPAGSKWFVGADFISVDDEGAETIYITDLELEVDLGSVASFEAADIALSTPDFTVPESAADVFDATKDFTMVLEDGTEIYIPANAITVDPDADGNSEVRFAVSPYADGLVKGANDQPLNYGYKVELYDSSGKEISEEFAKEVTMTMSFDSAELAEDGISAGDLNMSFYSSEKNAWENTNATVDEDLGLIISQMTHFSNWAPTAPASSGDASTLLDTVLTGSTALSSNWYLSSWFGLFYYDTTQSDLKWVHHKFLGWIYISATDANSIWTYSPNSNLGWLWTSSTQFALSNASSGYPSAYLYRSSDSRWLYYVVDEDSTSETFEQNWFHQFIAGSESEAPGWIQYNE